MSNSFYNLSAKNADGGIVNFSDFKSHPLIIVNVASLCGLSKKNYNNLADLLSSYYHSEGLRVLLFPCNQYLKQEPHTLEKIQETVNEYSSRFILFDKVDVIGKHIHPVFKYLVDNSGGFLCGFIKWNFTKFLVDRDGKVVGRYGPMDLIKKDSKEVMELLKRKQSNADQ